MKEKEREGREVFLEFLIFSTIQFPLVTYLFRLRYFTLFYWTPKGTQGQHLTKPHSNHTGIRRKSKARGL